ncbi:hypothetical protein [Moraxella sp. ZY210820]|uniref:hypothetical protein n=1 Tax=Moraxella sp. ZY210820 TaxID=2904123 RepID=UPI002730C9FB|nr:hypothetical protein [Moraxella sp. ZY210820]WLF84834.1 hypothetical protein LU301_05055 [Moraxella sp. ZY210820]
MKVSVHLSQKGEWSSLFKIGQIPMDGGVKVGVLNNKPHITSGNAGKPSIGMADLAEIHEYGDSTRHIPERSFLRASLRQNESNYVDVLESGLFTVLSGEMSIDKLKHKLGLIAHRDVVKYISTANFAPLKPSTIKRRRKQSNRPLVDTGNLRNSLSFEVE